MKLTKKQIYVLEMSFSTFLTNYTIYNTSPAERDTLISAVMELKGCGKKEACEMKMKELVHFSNHEWLACKGIGRKKLDVLCDALEEHGLSTHMDLNEPDDSDAVTCCSDLHYAFEHLQQQLVETGTNKCELRMIRPDGYTWVLSVERTEKTETADI